LIPFYIEGKIIHLIGTYKKLDYWNCETRKGAEDFFSTLSEKLKDSLIDQKEEEFKFLTQYQGYQELE